MSALLAGAPLAGPGIVEVGYLRFRPESGLSANDDKADITAGAGIDNN